MIHPSDPNPILTYFPAAAAAAVLFTGPTVYWPHAGKISNHHDLTYLVSNQIFRKVNSISGVSRFPTQVSVCPRPRLDRVKDENPTKPLTLLSLS